MEADSIGDDLEPFLRDLMHGSDLQINNDILDDVYEQQFDDQNDNYSRLQKLPNNYQRNNIQNIVPVQDNNQYIYLDDDTPVVEIRESEVKMEVGNRGRQLSESQSISSASPQIHMTSSSPERFSPPSNYPGYSPPFQSGNTPPRSAVEELHMSSPPHQPKKEIKQTGILQQKTNQRQQSNTVYIIQPVNVQNLKTSDLGGQQKKPKKVERNKAHNAIEKRYRHSINDRIDELRSILGGKDTKMSKSVVLRQAVEEIRMLRKRNDRLQRELLKYGHQVYHEPEPQSPEPDIIEDPSMEPPLRIGGTNSVRSDISRMVFCFAGILSLFVPFHHFVGFNSFWPAEMEDVEIYSTGRVLASIETKPIIQNEPDLADLANRIIQTWSPIFMFIFLNLVIFLYFMYRGLIHMEPITTLDSSEHKQFQKSFDLARRDFSRHNLESSRTRLNYCLTSLGRYRAQSGIEGIFSVLWSLLLYFSNKSGIKWFVCCIASKLGSDAHTDSSRMASLAYYMLAKVEFAEIEKFRVSRASLISYAAQSILLMEQAKEKMSANEICEIYIQGSLILRALLPKFLSNIICARIHRRASKIARKTELEGSLAWLSHPLGEAFLREPKLHNLRSIYCSSSMSLCPVAAISRSFRGHLFERISNALSNRYKHDMEEVLHLLDLLRTCSKSTNQDEYQVIDKVAFWWGVILAWNLYENDPECASQKISDELKEEMEIVINNIPNELNPEYKSNANPVQLLAVTNYCAYKASIGEIPLDCMLGTLTVMNETLQSSLQTIIVEQNKMDRITGLQLAASSADLVLCIVQKSTDGEKLTNQERMALVESARSTIGLMRNIFSLLPTTINRLEKWESFLSSINESNPIGIYASIRQFRDQTVHAESDSDSEYSTPIELCRKTKMEARQLLESCLPETFINGVRSEPDRGIT